MMDWVERLRVSLTKLKGTMPQNIMRARVVKSPGSEPAHRMRKTKPNTTA